jgi:hypothetical protein
MPKRSSKPASAKLDEVQNAWRIVQASIEQTESAFSLVVSRVMSEMGRKGGKIGGKRRLETMTDEQRKEIASRAAKARWAKRKKASKK